MASRLSIKPETLSRILARLRQRGLLVQIDGERIMLLDEPGLRAELERQAASEDKSEKTHT